MNVNIPAEFALLASLCKHPEAYFELQQYLSVDDFTSRAHQDFFIVLQRLLLNATGSLVVTKAGLLAEAAALNISNFYETCRDGELIEACLDYESEKSDLVHAFKQVKNSTVKRAYNEYFKKQAKYLKETTDPTSELVNKIDTGLFNLSNKLEGVITDDIIHLPTNAYDIIMELAEHPGELGVDIGFPIWQRAIGGLRNGSITFIAASAKRGKCFHKDTKIYNPITDKVFTIKDDIRREQVLSFDGEKLVCDKPIHKLSNGVKSIYEVKTKSGRRIKCTDNHPFLTCVGFKKLKELSVNNSIALPKYYPEPAESVTIDDNIASFLGLMVGDGGCGKYKSFTNEDNGIIRLFEQCTTNLGITHNHR
ncbi:MAG: DnaB-like helicase N-terminal domain-containing protein, partial [Candidatus Kariarchaeaceae archaeon]